MGQYIGYYRFSNIKNYRYRPRFSHKCISNENYGFGDGRDVFAIE